MSAVQITTTLAVVALAVASNLRWWRVAQREHYEPGRIVAIAALWNRVKTVNTALLAVAAGCAAGSVALPWLAPVAALVLVAWPLGLSLRPTSARLVWTPRLRRVAMVSGALQVVIIALLALVAPVSALAFFALIVWVPVEIALSILKPVEARMSQKFVDDAKTKLSRVQPDVVAITGSYGKTSTKAYAAHLLAAARTTVASPASFNNLMGLSKAVNERLTPGTDVFIAEMGTYGPGEIRNLTSIFNPRVAAITTIGEAHLERMKNRETIVAAKSEITEGAEIVVLNVDVPELDALARRLDEATVDAPETVVRCSTSFDSDARVQVLAHEGQWIVRVDGQNVTELPAPAGGHPINLAIALGIVVGLGVDVASVAPRMTALPTASNRAEMGTNADGVIVIDDTYNSNPVGAAAALEAARGAVAPGGRIVTITPGMIELGVTQAQANTAFAQAATAEPHMSIAITGLTNRKALTAGAGDRFEVFASREAAAKSVMPTLRAGDVVVFENDLPDHYP